MDAPMLLGYPIPLLFLYFIFYSFCGWVWETAYCSIKERHYVPRGFLYGPLCPIYGVGFLLMILFFAPFRDNLVVFYFVAVVVMTAWEYLVGWFLETTTHIKYWDYSHVKLNIKGRVCLPVSLFWGVMSYVAVFWIHPPVARLFARIPMWLQYTLCGSFFTLLAVDTVTTVRKLALVTRAMNKLQTAGDELRLQMALAKADLGDNIEEVGEQLRQKLDGIRGSLPPSAAERLDRLMDDYNELLARAERQSRRFRNRYVHMTSQRYTLDDVRAYGAQWRAALRASKERRKAARKAGHSAK
ncbi:Predicted membrane protein [uncultured Clostridium sp.]|nr:Predicted membrane protein [uncultured Clostridium sp.]